MLDCTETINKESEPAMIYFVCDATMFVVANHATLWEAKQDARMRSMRLTDYTYFVCRNDGTVIAGYTNGK